MFCHDKSRLFQLAERHQAAWEEAEPFPHVVIDDFLPEPWARAALEAFPSPERMEAFTWQEYERKGALRPGVDGCPEALELTLNSFNSGSFVSFLEVLTGIHGLVGDPHFDGGGAHQTLDGGRLGVHVDFNFHKALGLYRRLNLIYFLNPDWQDEYGGHLELWDREVAKCQVRVAPIFNRAVLFETSDHSWHGHPDPMRLPPGVTRKSLALYFYASGQGEQELEFHWTRHRARPARAQPPRRSLRHWLRLLTPPIVDKLAQRLRR